MPLTYGGFAYDSTYGGLWRSDRPTVLVLDPHTITVVLEQRLRVLEMHNRQTTIEAETHQTQLGLEDRQRTNILRPAATTLTLD